jgi:type IV pilus assembly protein PilM
MGLVGVDFGTRGIKMLQLREISAQGDLEVVGAARVDVPLAPVAVVRSRDRTKQAADNQSPARRPASPLLAAESQEGSVSADGVAEMIRSAFATGGFAGRRCVVSLAREDLSVQSVRLPKMSDDELRQTVSWEAAQRFGFDRNAMEVDFIRTGATLASGENREEIILVGAPHEAINARVEPVLAAGLRPVAVDSAFAALVRTFSRRVRRESDVNLVRVVLEIGASGSTVLILRGDQIAFCKPLSISGTLFNRAVAEHLQMSEADAGELRQQRLMIRQAAEHTCQLAHDGEPSTPDVAQYAPEHEPLLSSTLDPETDRAVYAAVRPVLNELAKEVTLCLRYYGVTFRGQPPERIILTGGDALEPKLDETIARACQLRVSFDDTPGALTALNSQIEGALNRTPGPASCWSAAMGLSLRGIGGRRGKSHKRPPGAVEEDARAAA